MSIKTVAILSPGDMGHAVGRALRASGLDVVSCLAERSQRTRKLATQAGIRDLPSLETLVVESDLILSILAPSEAVAAAERVCDALQATSARTLFVDCNAVSPATVQRIDAMITDAGGRCIDAGIIGSPPGKGAPPRFYASGPHAASLAELDGRGISVRLIGGEIGRASGIKMCYAALTKGTAALYTALLTAAEALGIMPELQAELATSQPGALKDMESITGVSAKAFRWVGEMEEIAATFAGVGVSARLHLGAADVFRMIAASPLGDERPETIDTQRTLAETIAIFAKELRQGNERAGG